MHKVFILSGHPDAESMCCNLAESYKKGAEAKGYEVRITHLANMKFDPILHKGYKVIQELEPELVLLADVCVPFALSITVT
jgi:putative NADPH-quinone reductase